MPTVLLMGLPGTGKSTLAAALAARLNGHVLNKDTIRHAIFGPHQVAYTAGQDDLVHRFMLEAAESLRRKQPSLWIFFDGRTYAKASQRQQVAPDCVIECIASDELIRQRLQAPHPAANRNWDLVEHIRRVFEPMTAPHLTLDTSQPLEACLEAALTYLTAAPGTS